MHHLTRYTAFKTALSTVAVLTVLLVFASESVFCQSPGITVDQKYPGLVSGVLKNARLEPMDEKVLLKSEGITINRTELAGALEGRDDRTRSQLEKNLLFVLEQEASRKILLNEAEKAGLTTKGLSEQEIFRALFDRKTETVEVTEKEVRSFYRNNSDMVNDMPFEKVKGAIRDYLLQDKKQQAVSDYIQGLAEEANIRVNEKWIKEQSRIAMDNPVDRARSSGLPAMVQFGADGCPPCDKMQPILKQMRKDFAESLNVVFVNVKKEQMLAARFGIRSIPVQVFFDADGREVFRHTGFLSKDKVYEKLDEIGVEEQSAEMFTIGSGPVEVVLFSDYFCPPCRNLEPYLEQTLPELVSSGAKVTFVDAALKRKSSLYARYFLYAARAASSPESVIHARRVLFDLAGKDSIESGKDMRRALEENNVEIEFFDTQPMIDKWKEIMEKHQLRSTPTCVIIKPDHKPEQHRGGKAIPDALDSLLDEMSSSE